MRDDKYASVVFIQPTKGSKMRNEIQRCADRNNVRIKVVEKVDSSIRRKLQKSDPFRRTKCERIDCVMCKLDSEFDCRTRGCVYQLECVECGRKYRGQTGNSGYERVNQHFDDWKRKLEMSIAQTRPSISWWKRIRGESEYNETVFRRRQ